MTRLCNVFLLAALLLLPTPTAAQAESTNGTLLVALAPSILPANGETHRALFVQLADEDGKSMPAKQSLAVRIVNANASVVSAPERVVIEAGSTYARVPVTTTRGPGTARLTASATGFGTASVDLTTLDPAGALAPLKLAVSPVPASLTVGQAGFVTVSLLGENGAPYLAGAPVSVVLTSSAFHAAGVQQRVEVPAGAHRVQVAWQAKDLGEASILAQADGFEAGSARVQAVTPVAIAQQWQVTVSDAVFAPGKQSGAGILVIQATDSRGNPAAMPCGPLYLSSSDVSVARVPPEAVGLCKDPLEPLTVPLEVTGLPGKASITVSSMGLLAATAQVTTAGTRPARLLVERGPAMPNSADPATAVLAMQLVGDNGVPVALHPGARISLLAEGAQLPPAADLVAGAAFVEVPVTARGGPVSITAVTERYGTTTDEFELRAPAMSASIASTGEGAVQTVNVHVTASGQPVAGAKVELDSDGSMQSAVTGPDGTASFQVTVAVDEMPVMVTARLQGYEDAVATTVLSPAFAFSGGATAPPYLLYGFLALACVAFLVYQAIGWRRQRMTGPEGRVS